MYQMEGKLGLQLPAMVLNLELHFSTSELLTFGAGEMVGRGSAGSKGLSCALQDN